MRRHFCTRVTRHLVTLRQMSTMATLHHSAPSSPNQDIPSKRIKTVVNEPRPVETSGQVENQAQLMTDSSPVDVSHALPRNALPVPTQLDSSSKTIPDSHAVREADASTGEGRRKQSETIPTQKKKGKGKGKRTKRNRSNEQGRATGSLEEVMFYEAVELLGKGRVQELLEGDEQDGYLDKFARFQEVELDIVAMSSHGEGLAITKEKDWIVAVPFCVPGERVLAKVYRNDRLHSYADLLSVLEKDTTQDQGWRDDSLIQCKYFGKCSGCQYQFLSYPRQLELKREVVKKAFQNFSGLTLADVPEIGATLPSPRQYQYRTKLTPHFDQPTKAHRESNGESLPIGFMQKGRRSVLDIEECPIGTDAIAREMSKMRTEVKRNLAKYKRGATLLLRDSLPLDVPIEDQLENPPLEASEESHICVTNHKAIVRERISNKFMFTFPANSFFQNNNGILTSLVECVRRDLLAQREGDLGTAKLQQDSRKGLYLVDAYCGSGLFGICLADCFEKVQGIEISVDSIKSAKLNAELNGIKNIAFSAGSAEAIFQNLNFPPEETVILIDPPRKGCDEDFLQQLLTFGPHRIVYVSCNVHTQARDIGYLLTKGSRSYKLDSIRGCDLFPQTYHVEGLALLSRR